MAIKPVEYIKDSSTVGFAEAGDQKQITKSTANTIQKDVDQGNTKDLDNAQTKYLEGNVDYDTLDYSDEEMEKVGEQQIDTKGEDGEDLSEKNGKGGAAAATVANVGAGLLFASAIATSMASTKVCNIAAAGFAQLAMSIGASVAAAGSIASVVAFDPAEGERKAQTQNAESNNAIIQQYYDTLNSDMDMMNQDVTMYEDLSAMQTEAQVETINNLGSLQAELQVYQSQGNSEKVAEIKAQMEDIKKTSEEDSKGPQEEMDTLKENINTYTGNNAEAVGVKTSGDVVAEFLKTGNQLKTFAVVNQYALLTCALCSFASVASSFPKLPFGIDFAPSLAAKILYGVAGALFTTAALKMKNVAQVEDEAGKAGDNMATNLANLQANIDGQAGYTEATSGSYGETDEAATETIEKNQESTDKANGKDKKGGSKSRTNSSEGFGFTPSATPKSSGTSSGSKAGGSSPSTTSSPSSSTTAIV